MNKPLSNSGFNKQCASTLLGEVCDSNGTWHTGFMPYGKLAEMIGTTTADLMRRLRLLGIVEADERGRHKLTRTAIRKCHGEVYWRKPKGSPALQFDVILPEGMVEVVTNLEATNLPETEIEKLRKAGLSQRDIAFRLDLSQQAVSKHLNSLPPRLTDWPIVGTWDEDDEGESDNQPSLAA
ncbi:winged helix-turn-helix domain-containing protein [Brucella anthropi]|uniref:winged helix-turn-helix domain-containing protein n=1 Tax=Brucella anthropi TaxID=529 RepID=UPI0021652DA1|nr:winged helix-turn-helix domain-containing protein [Brucella anthropi]UVV66954.1 winged helix-turn-helix domain-containing protein [Brucella anthropi]